VCHERQERAERANDFFYARLGYDYVRRASPQCPLRLRVTNLTNARPRAFT